MVGLSSIHQFAEPIHFHCKFISILNFISLFHSCAYFFHESPLLQLVQMYLYYTLPKCSSHFNLFAFISVYLLLSFLSFNFMKHHSRTGYKKNLTFHQATFKFTKMQKFNKNVKQKIQRDVYTNAMKEKAIFTEKCVVAHCFECEIQARLVIWSKRKWLVPLSHKLLPYRSWADNRRKIICAIAQWAASHPLI